MRDRTHWIFDLDGTLTVAVHDYAQMRRDLGLPEAMAILEAIAVLAPDAAAEVHHKLDAIERHYADLATPAAGAADLLDALKARGATVGILTRNRRSIALRTLEVIGLAHHFDPAHVLGRHEAPFKPDPAGVHHLLSAWSVDRDRAWFVGDSRHDLEAAENAGVPVAIVNPEPSPGWSGRAARIVDDLHALVAELEATDG